MGWPGVTRWVFGGREVVFEGRDWWGGGEEERERGREGGEGVEMENGIMDEGWWVYDCRFVTKLPEGIVPRSLDRSWSFEISGGFYIHLSKAMPFPYSLKFIIASNDQD